MRYRVSRPACRSDLRPERFRGRSVPLGVTAAHDPVADLGGVEIRHCSEPD